MSTTLGLLQDDLAPLITILHLSKLASQKEPARVMTVTVLEKTLPQPHFLCCPKLPPRLSNVTTHLVRFTHIPNARVLALHMFMTSHSLYALTFRNIQLRWRVLVVIAQCSSLKELRMEDPLGSQPLYPTDALAAVRSPKPVLEILA
ncbi:hypothetical protein BDZ89DRAFT_1143001 [Hymenopellis radicata]|nr:hypothetical protein BDZ89DRAFT_1143001 [Hymenopellis radicata]